VSQEEIDINSKTLSNAEQAQATHEEIYDDHCSTAKMGGESGPTERGILFMKTKILKTREYLHTYVVRNHVFH
jgi:hypothetical protein